MKLLFIFLVDKASRRIRLPRYIGASRILEPYDPFQAAGQKILHSLGDGKWKHHFYLYHATINPETIILLSTVRYVHYLPKNMHIDLYSRMFCLILSRSNTSPQYSWSSSRTHLNFYHFNLKNNP